jgi:predicted AAA+ superfamily ATPase
MIERTYYLQKIQKELQIQPVCAILGPRQCGKTTLVKQYCKNLKQVHYFDLENPDDLSALQNPSLVLQHLRGFIVIDEIQRLPNLFNYLRFLVDNSDKKFLILGSASQELIQQASETLAGRISYIELPPFQLREINDISKHWIRGGFPKSFLASSDINSEKWRINYIKTFLERDLLQIGIKIAPSNMRRLWSMLAHYHGQIANISDLSKSLGMTDKTIKRYMDILEGCFMIRQLKPWYQNISKRQVKRPKLYIRDSGILHSLLGISSTNLYTHPKSGASWEGYALENIIQSYDQDLCEFYFWRTEKGAEIDLLKIQHGKYIGYEFKYSENPKITKSMHIALEDLNLSHIYIVIPGKRSYPLSDKISALSLNDINNLV